MRSRWGFIAVGGYAALVAMAAIVALLRLAESADMPGLAAYELLLLGLPWTLVLETPPGRAAGGWALGAIIGGAVAANAAVLYALAHAWAGRRRTGTRSAGGSSQPE